MHFCPDGNPNLEPESRSLGPATMAKPHNLRNLRRLRRHRNSECADSRKGNSPRRATGFTLSRVAGRYTNNGSDTALTAIVLAGGGRWRDGEVGAGGGRWAAKSGGCARAFATASKPLAAKRDDLTHQFLELLK